VYPDPQVTEFVTNHFVPVRVHVKRNSELFNRLSEKYNTGAATAVIVNPDGNEQFRVEGVETPGEFLEKLKSGTSRAAA
jgi:hypothetical protein